VDELNHRLGTAELKLSADSQIGPYHVQMGYPNQDAYDFIQGDGFLSLAVADGAGSLERSDEGSELAVVASAGTAADLILRSQRNGTRPDLRQILAEAILEARGAVLSLDYWEQAGSTLVLALLTEDAFAVATVGDSFAVVQDSAGSLHLVQPPSVGEFANITKLLTSKEFTVSMLTGSLSELRGLALASDAFEHATLEQRVPTAGFWKQIFGMARQGKLSVFELIHFMDGQGKIEDDATLIALAAGGEVDSGEVQTIEEQEYSLDELLALSGAEIAEQDPIEEEVSPQRQGLPTEF